jgi:MFS family permease
MDALATTSLPTLRRRLLREPPRPARIRESPRARWYIVGAVCVGAFMGQLDVSIVTLALPHIGSDLHVSPGAVRWVSLAYLLVLACTLVPIGYLADRLGRKLLYTHGFAVFSAGSLLCGLAPSLGWLIGARVLQALGAAMLQANSVALIAQNLPSRSLARGLGVQGAAQAVGLALGPALGGLLLAFGDWRLVFLVNLPAGLLGIVLARTLLPRSRSPLGDPRDAPREPLRRPALVLGLGSAMASYAVMFGALYALPYYLAALHTPPALAGLQLAALPLALGIVAPFAGRACERVGARALTGGGLLLTTLGLLVLVVHREGSALPVGLALTGAGLGAFMPVNNAAIMRSVTPARAGVLSGVLNTARCLGTALGVALAGALYTAAAGAAGGRSGTTPLAGAGHGLSLALLALAAIALCVALGQRIGGRGVEGLADA